jgi:hypothetical protein
MGDGIMAGISLKDIKDYFEYETLREFSADWKLLSAEAKEQIRSGIENGSLTY